MREIVPDLLWIGHARDASDVRRVMNAGIKAVIDLAMNELPVQYPRETIYCRFPLSDGAGNDNVLLRAAIATTRLFLESRVRTLVFCSAGMSRTPAIVAAALSLANGAGLDEALRKVTGSAPHDVSPALWSEVRRIVER